MKVFFCRPYTCAVLALDVASEDEATLSDRMSRGAFRPKDLWEARPSVFRSMTLSEAEGLTRLGCGSFQVYEWVVTNNAVTETFAGPTE